MSYRFLFVLVFTLVLWFCFIFVFVFVIDGNDTQADEPHLMCLKTSYEIKNSADYLIIISLKVRSLNYNR